MYLRKLIMALSGLAALTFTACSDDRAASPNKQFNFAGDAVSMEDANLYLVDHGDAGTGHIYYDYAIVNGTYESGNTWSVASYEGATYLLMLRVGVPGEVATLGAGSYPVFYAFSDAAETSNIAWIMFESPDANYYSPEDALGTDVIKLSGGFEDGDMMTVRYRGELEYDNDERADNITGKFYFTGKVQDIRPSMPALKAARGVVK